MSAPFEPRGAQSIRRAAMALIRRLPEKDGITYAQAVEDLRELTGVDDLVREDIMGPVNQASKDLRALGEPGVQNRRGVGWQRETVDDMVAAGESHEKRARRQVHWAVGAVARIDVEKLEWGARHRREGILSRHTRQAELEERRAKRRRPLPPADGQAS